MPSIDSAALKEIILDRPSESVLIATLNRPDRRNAITDEMFNDFARLCSLVEHEESIRALIITGAGLGFCAGLDLDLAADLPQMPAARFLHTQNRWAGAVAGFRHLNRPVIAAVNGAAAGAGMGLALAADLRLAAPEARFNAAFVRIGLSGGDVGVSWMLPRIVGLGHASEILLTGRFVDADEAHRIGLVNDVVASDQLLPAAINLAETIAGNSPLGVQLTKELLQLNFDAPSLEAAIAIENRSQVLATRTSDMAEALTAFRERREPLFVGQ